MKDDHITKEVRIFVAEKLGNGEIVGVKWLANEMIQRKPDIQGDDCDFYIGCAHGHLSRIIKKVIGKYEPTEAHDEQLTLDGFERLQTGYPVERDGERVLVPTPQCTDEELLTRASEHREMARGNMRHAQELEDYVKLRRIAAE